MTSRHLPWFLGNLSATTLFFLCLQAEQEAAAALANGGDHKSSNGVVKNGAANGAANGNGALPTGKQRAADYYINGNLASDVHYRHAANGSA